MSIHHQIELDLGLDHICELDDCPGGDNASTWHQQRALALIHLLKQFCREKKYDIALEHAHELRAHFVHIDRGLIVRAEEAIALIPSPYFEQGGGDPDTSYEGT